jgi:hypothetical protein
MRLDTNTLSEALPWRHQQQLEMARSLLADVIGPRL